MNYYWVKYKKGNDPEKIKLCVVEWNYNVVGDILLLPIGERHSIIIKKEELIDYSKVEIPEHML